MNKSVYLLRANPALTTNIKVVVSSNDLLYLESYDSNRELSDKKYKKFSIDENVFLSERIAKFYRNLPIDLAYEIKNEMSSDNIQDNFANQYDSIYWSGARYVEDQSYQEEFQYNTTLKIDPDNIPKKFIIFRKDKTGADEDYTNDPAFFKDLKLIKTFDLSDKTAIGKLLEKNFITDNKPPRSPLELNFKEFEFSKWKGYNYYTGGNGSVSFFLQEYFQNENTYYNVEKFLTKGFRDNAIIAANYLNMSYLFNDTVSDVYVKNVKYYLKDNYNILKLIQSNYIKEEQYLINYDTSYDDTYYEFNEDIPYRKSWTINRYTGFYIDDKKQLDQISTYKGIKFKEGTTIEIKNNVFLDAGVSVNPIDGKYKEEVPIYLKIGDKFFLVEKNKNDMFVIVSDEIINGKLDDLLKEKQDPIKIEYTDTLSNPGVYRNYIKNINDKFYYNDKFKSYENGIIVIKIFDDYYTLHIDNIEEKVYINTDEYISANENILYRKLGNEQDKINNLIIENKDNNIIYFEIFILKFTDIKDFDFDKTNTIYSRKEYERNNQLDYFRPGIYANDIRSTYTPKELFYEKNYNIYINDGGTYTKLNAGAKYLLSLSSEYAASSDLYMLDTTDDMTDIWHVNQYVSKWGLNESVNNNSYSYKINNNLTYSGVNNFTSFAYSKRKDINTLNLDYFFTIGQPIDHKFDVTNFIDYKNNLFENIVFRTLNIDMKIIDDTIPPPINNNIHNLLKFDIDYYKNLGSESDYFSLILNQNAILNRPDDVENIVVEYNRISYLQEPDEVNGPEIYFKGFNAYVNYLQHKDLNDIGECKKIPATDLEGYEFSIIFSSRYIRDKNEFDRIGNGGIECIINKKFKNILINIYLCVPNNSMTNIEYNIRNNTYDGEFVEYLNYDDFTGSWVWKISTLLNESLTLNNFISMLDSNNLESEEYKDGIHYTIIEEDKHYALKHVDIYNSNNSLVKIDLAEEINLKHGDWVKLYNTSKPDYDKNVKVVEIINNRTIVIKVDNDQFNNISPINALITKVFLTLGVSDKPFEFEIKHPDKIKIDTNKYDTVEIDICPINAINNSNINKDVAIDINNDGLIENVYNDQGINTKNIKHEYLELNDNKYRDLPSIFRYSGDYEPILKDINLFNNSKIKICDTKNIIIEYITKEKIGDYYYASIHVLNNTALDNIKINDLIYINIDVSDSNKKDDIKFLEFTTHNIKEIKESYMNPLYKEIVLSTRYDVLSFLDITVSDYGFSKNMYGYIFKYTESNYLFEYDYTDFAINKNIIITKVYTTRNPMRTIKNINNTNSKYAMIDEHGSTVIDKNIFKSPWDLSYYYETLPNKYKKKT